MDFEPKYNGFKQKVEESFKKQKFMQLIDAKLIEVRPGYCEIHLPYHLELTQQHGYFHAGVIGTIADNASGYAAFSLMEKDSNVLTVEFKLNLLSPGDGDLLIAKAHVLKSGRTLTVCRSEVFIRKGAKETRCAASQTTLIQLKHKTTD